MKITVTGAVATEVGATLYLDDGTQKSLSIEDYKTAQIMSDLAGRLNLGKPVTIDLNVYSAHAIIEKKTGGWISFAINKVKDILGFESDQETTIVATVGNQEIPGMEKIERQMTRAAQTEDCAGFAIFMSKLAEVAADRGHTAQELLNFMKKADLPIADDGSIVAYKSLSFSELEGVFLDTHSKSVRQKLGSKVEMDISDVDPSRHTECSTGLHIARRSYLKHFNGDALTIVKIDPGDVIAVPYDETKKMRVMAYHIIWVMDKDMEAVVRNDQPMTKILGGGGILANMVSGSHVGVLEVVRVSNKKKTSEKSWRNAPEKIKTTEIKQAAETGDMSAAINNPKPKIKSVETLDKLNKEKMNIKELNDVADAAKPSVPPKAKPKPKPDLKDKILIPTNRKNAMKAVKGGMSLRQAAKQFKVCPKTLKKLMTKVD